MQFNCGCSSKSYEELSPEFWSIGDILMILDGDLLQEAHRSDLHPSLVTIKKQRCCIQINKYVDKWVLKNQDNSWSVLLLWSEFCSLLTLKRLANFGRSCWSREQPKLHFSQLVKAEESDMKKFCFGHLLKPIVNSFV